MTDDRTLERAARSWLEEGPVQAPDRAVDAALSGIHSISQERDLRIPWRLPTMNPAIRLAAIAVLALVVVGGAAFVLRPTSTVGPPATSPSPSSPLPSAAGSDATAQLRGYRAARDAVCRPAMQELLALFAALPSGASTSEQAANLDQNIALSQREIDGLAAIDAPPLFAEEHLADVQRHRDALVLIQQIDDLLHQGKQAEADAVDHALGGLSTLEEAFEQKYGLAPCP